MKLLTQPDSIVFKTLGLGKLPEDGGFVRPSLYAVPFIIGEKQLVFNTLTRQVLDAEEYFDLFKSSEGFAFDAANADLAELVKQRFIVALDANEAKDYLGTIRILNLLDIKRAKGHKGYVILPTTACNARCFYCYESGIQFKSMDEKTADDVVDYIIASKSDGPITIRWFGGEPLMGEAAIDRICAGLYENHIEFASSIVTNASLITPELAKKMREVWRVRHAQVTLDGRREEYMKRKNYVDGVEDPYEKAISGIRLLCENGVRVNIRLNADENNIDELMLLADELKAEFGETRGIFVYAIALFADSCGGERGADTDLHSRIGELSKKLRACGLARGGIEGKLRTYRCMADTPNGAAVIAPDGELFCCEHMIAESAVGSIYDHENEWERRKRFIEQNARVNTRPECVSCPFMPECTISAHCPIEVGADCIKDISGKIERTLLKFAD